MMTREEIKSSVNMQDVLTKYGLQANRSGFIQCPFHEGDREASMKIYAKDFNCFGCGANGDIFDFVMRMENCSFPYAFRILGGTYDHKKNDFSTRMAIYKTQKAAAMRRKRDEREEEERRLIFLLITVYRRYLSRTEPLSDVWCDCYNALQLQLLRLDDR